MFEVSGICCAEEVADLGGFAECPVNDGFAEVELFFDEFIGGFIACLSGISNKELSS